jgi:hypothetical protein
MVSRSTKVITGLLSAFAFMFACVFLSLSLLPYEILKTLGDHLSKDGNFESLTSTFVATIRLPCGIIGSFFAIIALGVLVFPQKTSRLVALSVLRVGHYKEILYGDLIEFGKDLRKISLGFKESVLLVLIMVIGIIPRVMLLNRPIEYDEAYTFIAFARHSFLNIITDYHVPNNHVFHTILVRISYLLFGDQAWQVRLPVFVAGIFIIPCTYLLGRMLYSKQVGYVAAGIVASLPVMIFRSVSARGYPIVTLMTLLGFIAAGYIIRRKNLIGWLLLILFCVIGLYTLPIMLYPVFFLFLWLLISIRNLSQQQYSKSSWIKYLCVAVLLIGFFTFLLYSPILLSSNIRNIYNDNRILHSMSFIDFIKTIPEGFLGVLTEWQKYLPTPWGVSLVAGLAISLWQITSKGKYGVPSQLTLLISTCVLLIIQRPVPVNRIWLWMVPLLIIWSSSGLVMASQILQKIRGGYIIGIFLLTIIVIGLVINGIRISHTASINHWGEDPPAEEITLALISIMDGKSTVITSQCVDAYYWFYFFNHGVSMSGSNVVTGIDGGRIFVIDDHHAGCGSSPVEDMLIQYGVDLSLVDLDTIVPVIIKDDVTVYEVQTLH